MKKFFVTIAAVLMAASAAWADKADYRVVPLPHSVEVNDQAPAFVLNPDTKIIYRTGNTAQKRNAELLAGYINEALGFTPTVETGICADNAIILAANLKDGKPEGYKMTVSDKNVLINGTDVAGTFHGIQTLRKAIGNPGQGAKMELPAAEVEDWPEFSYRGMHLDVARHFFTADSVKRYIDILALHNMNRFHWHLTDDQGWRLEIKKHPLLTEIGSKRKHTVIKKEWGNYDGIPYGGYFTQDQVRDIIDYAADRHITIIPEIDLPGHMMGVLSAYPELGCTGGPYEVWPTWGVSDEVLCIGNPATLALIDDVLNEVIDLFPSQYIHVGGDECPKHRWKDCPKCQAKMAELGIKGDDKHSAEEYLQSYVINHAEQLLNSRGRKLIGWDEILEGGLSPNATVMSWRGEDGGRQAAQEGHDAIMVPGSHFYFDHYQVPEEIALETEPFGICCTATMENAYSYNPRVEGLTDEQQKHIIGIQANIWTEYIHTFEHVEYMAMPRMAALAEVQWSAPEQKNYDDFTNRLTKLANIYDQQGYNYARTHMK